MKWLRLLALVLIFSSAFSLGAFAALEDELDIGGISDGLTEDAKEILGDYSPLDSDSQGALERVFTYLKDKARDIFVQTAGSAVRVLVVVLLCSMVSGLNLFSGSFDYVSFAGCLAIAVLTIGDINSFLRIGKDSLMDISIFSKALLPTLATAATAAGAATSAAIKYAGTAMFIDILITAANNLIFPMICTYTACVIASSTIGEKRIDSVVKLVKKAVVLLMTAFVTIFTGYLGITGVIASSTDAATVKAVKSAISTALPVVGRTISDAAGTIVAGAGVIKSSIGVYGLVAVLALCAAPFLTLAVRYLLFKAVAAISEPLSGDRMSKLIDSIGTVYGMILGVVGIGGILIFFGIISLIKVVGG